MKISYDRDFKIAGIGLVPWILLGPEQWFPNYAIASLYNWGIPASRQLPGLVSLYDHNLEAKLDKYNVASLLANQQFEELLEQQLPYYYLLAQGRSFDLKLLKEQGSISANNSFRKQHENKVWFRQRFSDRLPIPKYSSHIRADFTGERTEYDVLIGDQPKVLQDEMLKGGRGTFVVKSFEDYQHALASLERISPYKAVVISQFVPNASERSLQCCVADNRVFVGPLQRQIIAEPTLTNPEVVDGDMFCGGQILAADQNTDLHRRLTELARVVGEDLLQAGFRGIFGVDFLVSGDQVYVIEVNARTTGMTPLLTALYRHANGIPFYLLHILEQCERKYKIEDDSSDLARDGALLYLHSLEAYPVRVVSQPKSGTYEYKNNEIQYISDNVHMTELQAGQFVLQQFVPTGRNIRVGNRLVGLQLGEQILDENTDELYNNTHSIITAIRAMIVTEKY